MKASQSLRPQAKKILIRFFGSFAGEKTLLGRKCARQGARSRP